MATDEPIELDQPSAALLLEVVTEIKEGGKTYRQILDAANAALQDAQNRVKLIERLADLCKATRKRKPRCDAGKPRGPRGGKKAAKADEPKASAA